MSEKPGMKLAVECRGIERWFGEGDARVQVLRGANLNIGMGQLAMLVGPSGCGKTTLISIITGLLNASDGDVEVLGEKLSSLTNEQQIAFRQRDLGFVFQQFNLAFIFDRSRKCCCASLRRRHILGRRCEACLGVTGDAGYGRTRLSIAVSAFRRAAAASGTWTCHDSQSPVDRLR